MFVDIIPEPIKKWLNLDDKIKDTVELPNDSKPEAVEFEENLIGWNYSFDVTIRNIKDLVLRYREAAINFEMSLAIDDIINEAIILNESTIVNVNLDSLDKVSDTVKEKIKDEFKNILTLLDFNNTGDEIFRRWYVDGRLYYQNVVNAKQLSKGILKLNLLSPLDIMRVQDKDTKKKFFIWKRNEEQRMKHGSFLVSSTNDEGDKIWKLPAQLVTFVPSGLSNAEETYYISYIHKSLKPLNQLKLIEDSAIIYRITRAPERRVFYIDVGKLPKKKAEAYVKKLINKFKNKVTYDAGTGELSQKKNSMTLLEDFYLPSNSDQKGTKVETLQGGKLTEHIDDIVYFKKKLYKSLNVPTSRVDQDDSPGVNFGQQGELTREELKFTKFIKKLQAKFANYLFLDILKKQLIFKKIINSSDWEEMKAHIIFIWETDSYYTQLKEDEILRGRIELLGEMEATIGKYHSHEYARKSVLRQTDDEIENEDKLILSEKTDKRYNDIEDEEDEDDEEIVDEPVDKDEPDDKDDIEDEEPEDDEDKK